MALFGLFNSLPVLSDGYDGRIVRGNGNPPFCLKMKGRRKMKRALLIATVFLTLAGKCLADPPVRTEYAIVYFTTNLFIQDDTNTPLHVRIGSTNVSVLLERTYWAFSNDTGVVNLYNANGRGWSFTDGVISGEWVYMGTNFYIQDEGTYLSNGDMNFSGTDGGNIKMANSAYLVLSDGPQTATLHSNLVVKGNITISEGGKITLGGSDYTNWNQWAGYAPTNTLNLGKQNMTNVVRVSGTNGSTYIQFAGTGVSIGGTLLILPTTQLTGSLDITGGNLSIDESRQIVFFGGGYINGDDLNTVTIAPSATIEGPANISGLTTISSNLVVNNLTLGLSSSALGLHGAGTNNLYFKTPNATTGPCGDIILQAGYGVSGGQSGRIYLMPGTAGAGTDGDIVLSGTLNMNEQPISNATIIVFYHENGTSAIYPDGTNLMYIATNGVVGRINMTYE